MDWLGEFWRRLSFLWNGRRIDRDLEEEMRFHVDMKALAAAESGSPAPTRKARRAAPRTCNSAAPHSGGRSRATLGAGASSGWSCGTPY
jgi:hypothetical protein